MAYTVAQYAILRKVSESTVKNWIKKLELELPQNPADNRQRLILSEHKRSLDACGSAAPASAPDFFDAELVPESVASYDRSEDTGMLLAEGSIVLARSQNQDNSPDNNKLLQRLKLVTSQYENKNTYALTQIQSDIKSQADVDAALQAARLIKIKEKAQLRGIQEYRLEKSIVAETKTDLELMELGLIPMGKSVVVAEEEPETLSESSLQLDSLLSTSSDLF